MIGKPAARGELSASVSLDADNLWSYLKTHGNPDWESRPSYLPVLADRLLDVWGEAAVHATLFVVGFDAAREDGAQLVARAHQAGHEVANHSYEHEPWLHRYSPAELEAELARTEDAIVAAGAPRPVGFRGPGYSLSADLLALLGRRGYRYDATTLPTWIGPVARAYYLRASKIDAAERKKREALFGSAREVLRPNRAYRWDIPPSPGAEGSHGQSLVELPVTVFPGLRTPFHVSYVLHLLAINERLAYTYVDAALNACRVAGYGPSLLLHPLDLLDYRDAPGLEFFPGMQLPAARKVEVVRRVLTRMSELFTVTGTGQHAQAAGAAALPAHSTATAGPAGERARADLRG
ncbi:MAG: polysaccharide deacetylase [Micrococcales bacterium]|nr:MAG: polysaccharide deacetylase [Micrococcales bacterium]PIE26109.1 MAG: polysaccharide deacetylase [Micrococcales bacterium]